MVAKGWAHPKNSHSSFVAKRPIAISDYRTQAGLRREVPAGVR
jgi:hypothetical protein